MTQAVNPTIFRAYDIRGVVDVDLSEGVYEALGRAAGTYYRSRGGQRIVVARDARLTAPRHPTSGHPSRIRPTQLVRHPPSAARSAVQSEIHVARTAGWSGQVANQGEVTTT